MEIMTVARTPLAPNSRVDVLHGIERLMLGSDNQVTPAVEHYLGGGTYARAMTVEPDVMVSGRMHKEATITVVLSGDVTVFSNHGASENLTAGDVRITPARTKRLWYSVAGAKLMTIHANPLGLDPHKSPQELEDFVLVPVEGESK
jgi:quercetin dioxygenase-like cupin family protein